MLVSGCLASLAQIHLDWAQQPKGRAKTVKNKNLQTKDIMITLVRIAFGAKAKNGTHYPNYIPSFLLGKGIL
jgi:hypothetical protein